MSNYFNVSENTSFISIGVLENNELCYLDLNLMNNGHNWGIVLVDPDGKNYTIISDYESSCNLDFRFENHIYTLNVEAPHDGYYEVALVQNEM